MAVYVMRAESEPTTYKIGRAKDPEDRLRKLKASNPSLKLHRIVGEFDYSDPQLEAFLHTRFSGFRINSDSNARECFHFDKDQEFTALFDECIAEFQELLPCLESAKEYEQCIDEAELTEPIPQSNYLKELCLQYSAAKEEKIAAENRLSYIEAKIKAEIGTAQGVEDMVDWTPSSRRAFNQAEFAAEHPQLHSQFKRTSLSRKSFKLIW